MRRAAQLWPSIYTHRLPCAARLREGRGSGGRRLPGRQSPGWPRQPPTAPAETGPEREPPLQPPTRPPSETRGRPQVTRGHRPAAGGRATRPRTPGAASGHQRSPTHLRGGQPDPRTTGASSQDSLTRYDPTRSSSNLRRQDASLTLLFSPLREISHSSEPVALRSAQLSALKPRYTKHVKHTDVRTHQDAWT